MNQYLSETEYSRLVKEDINNFKLVPEHIRYKKNFVLEIIDSLNSDPEKFLSLLSKSLKLDEDIWLKFVEKDPVVLKYSHRKMKANKTIVMAAIKIFSLLKYETYQEQDSKSNELLSIIDDSLRTDEDIAIAASEICSLADWYFPLNIDAAKIRKEYEKELPINNAIVKKIKI